MVQFNNFRSLIYNVWSSYTDCSRRTMEDASCQDATIMDYWRNRLFVNAMTVSLPLSIIAVIPSIIIEVNAGYYFVALLDILVMGLFFTLVLTPGISLIWRKISVGILIAVFAVLLFALMGSFSMGCIYLFALSIFIVLQYSGTTAFAGVIFNLVVCICFAVILNFKIFPLPLHSMITLQRWVLYSSNFLFLDLILVALIRQLLDGLEQTITKKSVLYRRLEDELILKNVANNLLIQSEEHYKTLFSQSPLSICIYDKDTLRFLQVNEAATRTYSYTEHELLNMTLSSLELPQGEGGNQQKLIDTDVISASAQQEIAVHLKKNGEPIHVEIKSSDFNFQGRDARLIITTDITEKVSHHIAIKKQNEKLKQIAYMQSHVVRVPLANIMGLTNLIMEDIPEKQKEIFNYLTMAAKQLDDVIRDIVNLEE